MTREQSIIIKKNRKLTPANRLIAALVFFVISGGFSLLWLSSKGYLNLSYLFGVCGFEQRFDLPCPGCGWTHAAEMFATGHFIQALKTQPAAAFFCFVLSLIAIFALHLASFGIDSQLLKRIFSPKGAVILLIGTCVVIVAGWLVNLIRTVLEN
jgi:hypothetical protein